MKKGKVKKILATSLLITTCLCMNSNVFAADVFMNPVAMPSAADWEVKDTSSITGASKKKNSSSKKEVIKDEKEETTTAPNKKTSSINKIEPQATSNIENSVMNDDEKDITLSEITDNESSIENVPTLQNKPVVSSGDEEKQVGFANMSFNAGTDDNSNEIHKPEVIEDTEEPKSKNSMDMPDMKGVNNSDLDVTVEKPEESGDGKKVEKEYRDSLTPDTDELEKPQVLSKKEAPSIMETTKWDISEGNRTNKILVHVPNGETRLEMFYSADAPMPLITFSSIDGNIYRTGEDFDNGKTKFICRPGNKIEGYSDINYCVMYFSAPMDPGSWSAEITLDKGTKEFMLIKSSVPNGWSDFVEEYRTNPQEMLLWNLSKNSEYSVSELVALADVDANPDGNSVLTSKAPVIEKIDYTIPIIIAIFVVLLTGMVIATILIIKRSQMDEKERTQTRISKANAKLKQKKEQQDKHLEEVLKEMDEDYSDDDYFSEKSSFDDVEVSIPVQKKMLADDELTFDNSDSSISINDIESEESTVIEMPSWLTANEDEGFPKMAF